MNEIKPLYIEKYVFEYRNLSILRAIMAISDYQNSDARKKINDFSAFQDEIEVI